MGPLQLCKCEQLQQTPSLSFVPFDSCMALVLALTIRPGGPLHTPDHCFAPQELVTRKPPFGVRSLNPKNAWQNPHQVHRKGWYTWYTGCSNSSNRRREWVIVISTLGLPFNAINVFRFSLVGSFCLFSWRWMLWSGGISLQLLPFFSPPSLVHPVKWCPFFIPPFISHPSVAVHSS